ncbi:MAG: hypothetical protein ACXVCP_06355 [Bdellovibrio sp.]
MLFQFLKFTMCFLFLAGFSSLAHAECISADPLCRVMHSMSGNFDCVQGQMPSFLCEKDMNAEVASLNANAQKARSILLRKPGMTEDQKVEINNLFDLLTNAIADLANNLNGDEQAKNQAIQDIAAIMKRGHVEFR